MQLRRTKWVIALTCVALSVSAVAVASTPKQGDWAGSTNEESGISFTIAKKNGKLRVRAFSIANFGFGCDGGGGGGARNSTAQMAAKVKDGKFVLDSPVVDFDGAKIHAEGKFTSKNAASGKMRWTLKDKDSNCTTGKLRWSAVRD